MSSYEKSDLMKKTLNLVSAPVPCVTILTGFFALGILQPAASAAPLKDARVTQIFNDVKLLPDQAASRPAVVNDPVSLGTAVRTGTDSRTELTFSDSTLARLGSQSIFSSAGIRSVELGSGSILLHVPKNSGGAQIKTAAVTAAVTGTTVVLETFNFPGKLGPVAIGDLKPDARYKVTVLEGEVKVCRTDRPEECHSVRGGQTLLGGANGFQGGPVAFETASWMASNVLVTGFKPLPRELLAMIEAELPSPGEGLIDAGNSITSIGTLNPANISAGGNEISPNEDRQAICHNGNTLVLPRKAAQKHLANHPTDTPGSCNLTSSR